MKKILLIILFLGVNSICFSQDSKLTNDEKQQILAESPFNNVYPESILKSSATYFKAQMGLYKEGAIAEKEAHLVALGTSAATNTGNIGTKAYLAGFQWSDPLSRDGTADDVAGSVATELEAEYTPEKVKQLRLAIETRLNES